MKTILSNIHKLCDGGRGQNYWFNGCMQFLMECLGEDPVYDYWFFSAVTGDSFTQIFSRNPRYSPLCLTDGFLPNVIGKAFDACGYTYDYVTGVSAANRADHYDRIRRSIDRGIPVLIKSKITGAFYSYGVICGYENDRFYSLFGDDVQPQKYPERFFELIFVKDKKACPSPAEVMRQAVLEIPRLLTRPQTADFSFGIQAFTDWADSLQNGMFRQFDDDDPVWYTHSGTFSCWNMHGNYLCMLGTNGCAEAFLKEALRHNPDMTFIEQLLPLFRKHNIDGFADLIQMEDGFQLSPAIFKNRERMQPIHDRIIQVGCILNKILNVFEQHNIHDRSAAKAAF